MKFQVTRGPKKDDFDLPATANLKDLKKAYAQKCTSSPPSTQQTSLGVTVDPSIIPPKILLCGHVDFGFPCGVGGDLEFLLFSPQIPKEILEERTPRILPKS